MKCKLSKKAQAACRTVNHLRDYANKCIELGVPVPFAAEITRDAKNIAETVKLKEKEDRPRCHRCDLEFSGVKTVLLKLSDLQKKAKKKGTKVQDRPVQLLVICKGCGAKMVGGMLPSLDTEKRQIEDECPKTFSAIPVQLNSSQQSLIHCSPKISSSARRRKPASKLQQILSAQTSTSNNSSLENFLETFKINT
ncbi:unnamed protein product [Thelazia callipaeda]|uniref:Uncharacterized protein n=1 Tax=Thelazia callipaeda TaxID=103827 RepID=A0A0N5CNG6_THECL|nr:unnamed protein product [Thelazia callipaeda]